MTVQQYGAILLFGTKGRVVCWNNGEATLLCTLPGVRSRFNEPCFTVRDRALP